MKRTSKLLSALLLLGQVVGYTPSVLADEEQPTVSTEQSTTVNKDHSTTASTDTPKEEDTTDSSINNLSKNQVNQPIKRQTLRQIVHKQQNLNQKQLLLVRQTLVNQKVIRKNLLSLQK